MARESRTIRAMKAAKCAQRQGKHLFENLHHLLFEAFHKGIRDTTNEAVLYELDLRKKNKLVG